MNSSGVSTDKKTDPKPDLPRSLFAEAIGTFFLTFADCGLSITGSFSGHEPEFFIKAFTPALLVAAMIYSIGNVSGAHINPAVTLAFVIRKVFKWQHAVLYWICQIAGATLAAYILLLLFGSPVKSGVCHTQASVPEAFFLEMILSTLLITVILGTATKHKTIGAESAMAVAAAISVAGLIGKQISDVSMNPARSVGPALIYQDYTDLWIFTLAPLAASVLALACTWMLHGPPKGDDLISANGEGE